MSYNENYFCVKGTKEDIAIFITVSKMHGWIYSTDSHDLNKYKYGEKVILYYSLEDDEDDWDPGDLQAGHFWICDGANGSIIHDLNVDREIALEILKEISPIKL